VASAIVNGEMKALENHSLHDIQDWADDDEEIANKLREQIKKEPLQPEALAREYYAAHAAAAGVVESLSRGANIPLILDRMIYILKKMHDVNASWGPLFVTHPGNLKRIRGYIPQ